MPGANLILIGVDPAILYTAGLASRERGWAAAKPQLRSMGLLKDARTAQQEYQVPMPTISVGRVVRFKDGTRPGSVGIQGYSLGGVCEKRGIEGLKITEGDRLAAGMNMDTDRVMDNIRSHGQSERLLEDKEGTVAIEQGEDTTLQPSFDSKAGALKSFFSATHLIDPVKGNVAANQQSNLLPLALTVDNLFTAIQTMLKWRAENGADPIYQGFMPEFRLMVPPDLAGVAIKCLREMVPEGGAAVENVNNFYIARERLFVNYYLTDTRAWYLGVTNVGVELVTRVVHRERMRWDKGPDSALYENTKQIEYFSDEWTDYRLTDHRAWLKSRPA